MEEVLSPQKKRVKERKLRKKGNKKTRVFLFLSYVVRTVLTFVDSLLHLFFLCNIFFQFNCLVKGNEPVGRYLSKFGDMFNMKTAFEHTDSANIALPVFFLFVHFIHMHFD
jgi:hypothetical protein